MKAPRSKAWYEAPTPLNGTFKVVFGLALLLSLPMIGGGAQVQASEFTLYDGLLFKIYYPTGWHVSETGTVKHGMIMFQTQRNDTQPGYVAVTWDSGKNISLDATGWHNKNGNATMIDNDSYYLLGQRAVVMDAINENDETMNFATNVNGTAYEIWYDAPIDHFLNHLTQFKVMVASLRLHTT